MHRYLPLPVRCWTRGKLRSEGWSLQVSTLLHGWRYFAHLSLKEKLQGPGELFGLALPLLPWRGHQSLYFASVEEGCRAATNLNASCWNVMVHLAGSIWQDDECILTSILPAGLVTSAIILSHEVNSSLFHQSRAVVKRISGLPWWAFGSALRTRLDSYQPGYSWQGSTKRWCGLGESKRGSQHSALISTAIRGPILRHWGALHW